jgi:xanthine dehydrogenase/oxidase
VIQYKSLGPPLVATEDAIKAESFYTNPAPQKIQVGDAASEGLRAKRSLRLCHKCLITPYLSIAAITNSDHVISGEISCGSQYHFYMETHGCLCVPKEGGYEVYSSTQWPAEVQFGVAGVMQGRIQGGVMGGS